MEDIQDRDISHCTQKKLKFRKVPYAEWFVGSVFVSVAALVEYYLLLVYADLADEPLS